LLRLQSNLKEVTCPIDSDEPWALRYPRSRCHNPEGLLSDKGTVGCFLEIGEGHPANLGG
jgi:hypothetical protein